MANDAASELFTRIVFIGQIKMAVNHQNARHFDTNLSWGIPKILVSQF
jgi:hypothetical protein